MADGGVPLLSLVERALLTPGYRAVRKKLPAKPRKLLPFDPPEDFGVRREMVRRALRLRRQMIADEETPKWRVPSTAVAKSAGKDRGTVADWAADAPNITMDRGAVVIDGAMALDAARERGADVETIEQAIAWLDARLRTLHVEIPEESANETDPRFQPYPTLSNNDPTVNELAALIYDSTPTDRLMLRIERGRHLRAILAEHGVVVAEGARVSRKWLKTDAGQRFWIDASRREPTRKKRSRKAAGP